MMEAVVQKMSKKAEIVGLTYAIRQCLDSSFKSACECEIEVNKLLFVGCHCK